MANRKSARAKGNGNCFVCKRMHIAPFRRCKGCNLHGVSQCPPLRATLVLVIGLIVIGLMTRTAVDSMSKMVFVLMGMISVILLLLINSQTDEQSRTRERLFELRQELAEQHEFLRELSPLDSLESCLQHIVQSTASRLRCTRVSVMLQDKGGKFLHIAAAVGVPQPVIESVHIPIGEGVSGQVFGSDHPIHVSDTRTSGGYSLPIDSAAFMSGPLMLSGMRWGNVRLGVLSITSPTNREDFSVEEEFVFSNICEASAVAIYNHMAVAKVKQANVEFLETLVNAIEARDPYTRGHSERVSRYAEAIGRRLLLGEESLGHLAIAGRLHDIGKIGMTDAVLWKGGTPTEDEWEHIRRHPDIASEMLSHASVLLPSIDAIRCHHERLDGSGYPHGLKGAQIPLMARIVGVADAFDAMTTVRPYRDPLPGKMALRELQRDNGLKFDVACVTALCDAIQGGELESVLPKPSSAAGAGAVPEAAVS